MASQQLTDFRPALLPAESSFLYNMIRWPVSNSSTDSKRHPPELIPIRLARLHRRHLLRRNTVKVAVGSEKSPVKLISGSLIVI